MRSDPTSPAPAVAGPPPERAGAPAARRLRRRRGLARGPVVIGEPSPPIVPALAAGEPYRADTIADGGSAFGLTVRAASVRGLAKRWSGGPRQDDLCLALHEPGRTLIAAVADGVSGASRSHLGAALAVRHAVSAVSRQLDAGAGIDWAEAFGHAAWSLVEAERAAAGDPQAGLEQAARALATTLLVAVVRPSGPPAREGDGAEGGGGPPHGGSTAEVELAAVGDSCALLLRGGRFQRLLAGEADEDALLGAAVDALPRAASRVRSARLGIAPDDVLLLATDGFALPLGDGGGEVGALFAGELRRPPGIIEFARLLDFSRSTYDDDRSLVAVWAPPRS